jgi:hypothetical protein
MIGYALVRPYELIPGHFGFDSWPAIMGALLDKAVVELEETRKVWVADNSVFDETNARWVLVASEEDRPNVPEQHRFLGYDAGDFDTELGGHYSLIAHCLGNSAIKSPKPDPDLASHLNSNSLFDSLDSAQKLVDGWTAWQPLIPGDKEDFERGVLIRPYAVFEIIGVKP